MHGGGAPEPRFHYDKKFNKALSASIVLFLIFAIIGNLLLAVFAFMAFWIGYNGRRIIKVFKRS